MRSLHIPQTSPRKVRDRIHDSCVPPVFSINPHWLVGINNPEAYIRICTISSDVGEELDEVRTVLDVLRRNETG
jgi:hypothetical protein